MDFPTEVSFASDIDFTVEREVKVALQDTLSTQSLVVLTNVLNNFVLNEQTISLLKQFLLYIKTSLYMDVHISALADLLIKYQNIFVINDLCEIILVLAVKGVDFTQTNTTEFFNKLLFADEIMRVLGRDDKEDFIALFESTDAYRLNYIQRHCGKSEDDSEMLLLTTKFSVLVALLSVKGVFYPQELERLRNVLSQGYRQSKSSIRNCLVALEELASLEILGDFAEISDRTEILGLFVLYIEKHWFDPIVAKDIIAEFSRLKFINKVMDLYTLTNKRFLYIVDGMSYDIPDKPEIFGCWFGDPKLVALWKKLKPEDFNLRNLQTLLISAQVLYRSLGRFAPKAIRQDIYDELNSILLNKQYKKHRNLLKLAQDIPSDMWSLYVLNSCFDIHNTFEATLILYHLPLNIQRIFVRENDARKSFAVETGAQNILTNLARSIKVKEHPLSIYNKELMTIPYEFVMMKQLAWLEKIGTPLAFFACGLLLANGGSANPRSLTGQFFLDYQTKRLHDAVTFFNRAAKDVSLHRNVRVMKMCMFYKDESYTVNQRLLQEENPRPCKDYFVDEESRFVVAMT